MSQLSAAAAAGYVAAVISEQDQLAACFREAFTPDELLDAIDTPLRVFGRYVALTADITLIEACDALVKAFLRPALTPAE